MNKIASALIAAACLASATAGAHGNQPAANEPSKTPVDRSVQVYKKAEMQTWNRSKAELLGKFAYTRHQTGEQDAIREIGWLTLPAGASIGLHKHENNEDVYLIVEGKGTFVDGNGNETPVAAGDVTIARPGQSHALKNTSKKPLVFINFIGQLPSQAAPK